jgi:hypothetical protein
MKRGTIDHPKMLDLAEAIDSHLGDKSLGFDMSHTMACGIMEKLWHYTARYSPAGDVGKHSDARIARAVGWTLDAQWIIKALTDVRFIDELDGCRLYVHDWHQHSDDAADKWLRDKGLQYANEENPRRRKETETDESRHGRKKSRPRRDKSSQSEPEPKPKPSSEPESSSKPKPEPTSAVATSGLDGVFEKITLEDLKDTGRLLAWYERQAGRERPLIDKSDANRLRVIAAAERALEVPAANRPGLFISLFDPKNAANITEAQDERARRRLRDYDKEQRSGAGVRSAGQLIGGAT